MKAPQKTGLKADGRPWMLESYLLECIERPVPPAPTHYVVAEVLNTDLSIKRVTIYFNSEDTWKGNYCYEENSPKGIGLEIGNGLVFLNRDPNTLAYKCWVVEIATGQQIVNGHTYFCTKCEL